MKLEKQRKRNKETLFEAAYKLVIASLRMIIRKKRPDNSDFLKRNPRGKHPKQSASKNLPLKEIEKSRSQA